MKLSVILIALFLTGCSHSPRTAQRLSSRPSDSARARSVPAKQQAAPPISEITIERVPGMSSDPPPMYALTLQSDGTATYIGAASTNRIGTYRAKITPSEFIRIAQLVEDSHFVNFAPFYGLAVDDISEVSVSVVRQGERKTVVDYGLHLKSEKETPQALKEIEQQIDAAVANAQWVQISDKTETPRYIPKITFGK